MAIRHVCVVGAGAIGSLLAGHLAQEVTVSVLTRRPKHAQDLRTHGLRVTGKSQRHVWIAATSNPAELDPFDVAIVAVKATDLEVAAASLAGLSPQATVVTIQNGIGAEEVIQRSGPWPIISAVTFMSGTRHSDVEVQYELDTPTWMGPWAGTQTSQAIVEQLAALINRCGLKAEALQDLLPAQWSKLIFNAAVNGVAALSELPHVELFAREEALGDLGHLVHALTDEGAMVACAAGIELREDAWEMNRRAVSRGSTDDGAYAHVPSMLSDVRARQPTENEFISGAIARAAEAHGVSAPLNAAVYRLIKAKEVSWNLPNRP